ncbi:MAG: hypothetical protein GXY36_12455 [Chloroflexi bacterium]|nr:hypothetical protein [Chloroflexota bacterium]
MIDARASNRAARPVLLALLALILLLAWGLRMHKAEARSLWADEGWTMLLSQGPGLDDVVRTLADDQHPPLFFVLFRVWRGVAGETEFATRYFSILAGVLAVAAIYPLGRALFGPLTGLLAALLLALADNHIDLSQEVRHYGLLALLIVLSSLFYARWWRRPTRAHAVGYVLASIALLYTHYLGGFVLIVQLAHMLLTVRPARRLVQALVLFGTACAGFLPWLPVVIEQNSVRWDNPLYYQNALPNSVETYRAVRTALLGSHYGLLAALLLLGLVYLVYRHAGRERWPQVRLRPVWPALYLALWIVLVVGATVVINARSQFLTVRNFIVITPAILLLIAHGLANLDRLARGMLVAVIVIVGLTTVDARRHYPDWRSVTRNVTDYHLVGEPVLMDVWVGDFPLRYYIDRQMGGETPRVSLREWRDTYGAQFLPTLLGYLQEINAFWLVYWGDEPMDEYGDLIAQAGFQRSAALAVDHLGTRLYSYRYDRVPDTTLATFGDLLALRQADAPSQIAPGETLRAALWWTAEQAPPLDYSVSVLLLTESGVPVAQHDGPPLDGASPTSTWQPGDLRFDLHRLPLPEGLSPGTYRLAVKVYWYGDGQPLPVQQDDSTREFAVLGEVEVTPG